MKKIIVLFTAISAVLVGTSCSTNSPNPENTQYTPRHKTTNKVPPKPVPTKTPTKTHTTKAPLTKPTATKLPPFKSCKEVFEAGTVPIYPSNPRWNPKLDRDGDGMACEH